MNTCSHSGALLVEIAPNARLGGRRATLTYQVPDGLAGRMDIGQVVWAPLKDRVVLGLVVALRDEPSPITMVRAIHSLVEPEFKLSATQLALAAWIAENTICSLFDAAALMLPPRAAASMVEHLRLVNHQLPESSELPRLQRKLVDLLGERGEVPLNVAQRELGSSLTTVVDQLVRAGHIERVARVKVKTERTRAQQLVVTLASGAVPPERTSAVSAAYDRVALRLRARPERSMPLDELQQLTGLERARLRELERRGLVRIQAIAPLPRHAVVPQRGPLLLTSEQAAAWAQLQSHLTTDAATKTLLQGVTGSGKTELYFRAAAQVLAGGESVILLVPEITLAGQLIQRARERFGEQAVVLHSELRDAERLRGWRRAASGEPLIIVGPRSALFAPLPAVGLIVVDEEHDPAYKQDRPPRYHARAVAERLAELHGALLIFGSATPDVETAYRARSESWSHLVLTQRVGQRVLMADGRLEGVEIELPEVSVVDMRSELREHGQTLISRRLHDGIDARLRAGEQALLFLNRRGSATFIQCRTCGGVQQCSHCDVPLVYHRAGDRLICHRCGDQASPHDRCPACGSTAIGYYGAGTQRVESDVRAAFPRARTLRWDRDSVRRGGQERMLQTAQNGEIDIIVGTQMIAKGLDLPGVTLVGIINADGMLYLPDFRAAERTFQLLAQVSGRAGRRTSGSDVILQTFTPEHYAVRYAARHDYDGFYTEELAFRRRLGYPPFKRLARLTYRHADFDKAAQEAERLADIFERWIVERPHYTGVDLIGPAPAFAGKVRDRYVWQLLLRGELLTQLLGDIGAPPGWTVDIDPVSLL